MLPVPSKSSTAFVCEVEHGVGLLVIPILSVAKKNPPATQAGHTAPGAASGDINSVDTYSERASARPGTSSAPTGTVALVPSKSSPMGSYRPPR